MNTIPSTPTSTEEGSIEGSLLTDDPQSLAELEFLSLTSTGISTTFDKAEEYSHTAPLITKEADLLLGLIPGKSLLGELVEQKALLSGFKTIPSPNQLQLYLNVQAPFSALVCGVQVNTIQYIIFTTF